MDDDQTWGTAAYRLSPEGRIHMLREYLAAGDGPAGKLGVLRVLAANRMAKPEEEPSKTIPVAMRGMGGTPLHIRPSTTDLSNATAYLARRIYDPPPEVTELRRVVELGSNMGAGLTALAIQHPDAELVGVEPDPGNVAVARRNFETFGSRVRVIEAAAWTHDAVLVVDEEIRAGEHGVTVRERKSDDRDQLTQLEGRTIDSLLDDAFPGDIVDYVHVTIEGSERRVFDAGGGWPERVRSLRVEVHAYFDYPAEDCIAQLESLGYRAYLAPHPPDKWVFAVRDDL